MIEQLRPKLKELPRRAATSRATFPRNLRGTSRRALSARGRGSQPATPCCIRRRTDWPARGESTGCRWPAARSARPAATPGAAPGSGGGRRPARRRRTRTRRRSGAARQCRCCSSTRGGTARSSRCLRRRHWPTWSSRPAPGGPPHHHLAAAAAVCHVSNRAPTSRSPPRAALQGRCSQRRGSPADALRGLAAPQGTVRLRHGRQPAARGAGPPNPLHLNLAHARHKGWKTPRRTPRTRVELACKLCSPRTLARRRWCWRARPGRRSSPSSNTPTQARPADPSPTGTILAGTSPGAAELTVVVSLCAGAIELKGSTVVSLLQTADLLQVGGSSLLLRLSSAPLF